MCLPRRGYSVKPVQKCKLVDMNILRRGWRRALSDDEGQDVAEYAVMLAVILALIMGLVRMAGANSSNVFSQVGSAID